MIHFSPLMSQEKEKQSDTHTHTHRKSHASSPSKSQIREKEGKKARERHLYKWALSSTSISPIDFSFVLTQENNFTTTDCPFQSSPPSITLIFSPVCTKGVFIARAGYNDDNRSSLSPQTPDGCQRWEVTVSSLWFYLLGSQPSGVRDRPGSRRKTETWERRRRRRSFISSFLVKRKNISIRPQAGALGLFLKEKI